MSQQRLKRLDDGGIILVDDKAYDQKCYDLAIAFLSGYKLTAHDLSIRGQQLAQELQEAIEDYISVCSLVEKDK